MTVHQGSWFGLPDAGLTEWAAGLLGQQRNSQGGSNLIGPKTVSSPGGGNVGGGGYYAPSTPTYTPPTPTASAYGQVNGANTSVYNTSRPSNSTPQPSYSIPNPSDYENRIRGNINSAFDSYYNDLNRYESDLGNYQNQDLVAVDNYINTAREGLNQSKSTAMGKLDTTRQQIQQRGAKSISDVSQNLRNMLSASRRQLSAMGAGDSSATEVQTPYAYSKLAARERGNVQRQINDQNTTVDLKAADVETQYNAGLQEIEANAFQQKQGIRDKYLSLLGNIRQQKINAPLQRVDALNRLEENIMNNARAELSQIDSERRQMQYNLQNYMASQNQALSSRQAGFDNTASYTPNDIGYNQLSGMDVGSTNYGGGAMMLPYYRRQDSTY